MSGTPHSRADGAGGAGWRLRGVRGESGPNLVAKIYNF